MGRTVNQKLKLLYLNKILFEETDENHSLTINEIVEKLDFYGIKSERKSLYNDFEALRNFGVEIEKVHAKNTSYYSVNDAFEMPQLKLMVDAVQCSKFITKKKSQELINKIQGLCSFHEAKKLQRQVYVAGRVKTLNENIYYNVDIIYSAIDVNKKIAFNYFEFSIDKTQKIKRKGEKYLVSPMALVWDDENYYLLAYENDILKHFRVDKMLKMDIIDQLRENVEFFQEYNLPEYSKKVFSMFGGRSEKVKIKLNNGLIGVIIDRFGKDVIINKVDDDNFSINVDIEISPQFFGWLAGLGEKAVIVFPENVKEEYKKYLQGILNAQ